MGYEFIQKTIPEQLTMMSKKYPDKAAYLFPFENIRLTFKEIKEHADKVAKALLALDIKHGDHIGIWSYNRSAWIELLLGASEIGVVAVPLNTCYSYEELDDLCRRADLNALFFMEMFNGESYHKIIRQFVDEKNKKESYPFLHHVISMEKETMGPYPGWNEFLKQGEKISDFELKEYSSRVSLQDDYLIQYTSGTTSKPKGAVLYQYGAMNTAKAYAHLLHLDERDCTCVPLPLFHCFGNILTLLGGLISGSTTIYLSYFSPKQMLTIMQEEYCTCMMGVPTMYFSMLGRPDFESYDLSHLVKAGIGGAICPYELCKRISDGFQVDGLIVGYGLSEAASLCTLSDIYDDEAQRMGSVGKPLPGLEVSLADESGHEDPLVSEGELLIRGYGVMKYYYKDEEHTAQALDSKGWLHTGDLGRRNPDNTFLVIGRLKDIVIKGGENISPSSIEEKLLTMDNIQQCQCVGVPDTKYGETVCACIISEDGNEISLNEVQAYLKNKISAYKIPDYVVMMDEFPINGSGKVIKKELAKTAKMMLHLG